MSYGDGLELIGSIGFLADFAIHGSLALADRGLSHQRRGICSAAGPAPSGITCTGGSPGGPGESGRNVFAGNLPGLQSKVYF